MFMFLMKTVPYDIPNGESKSGKIAVRFPNSSARDKGVKAIIVCKIPLLARALCPCNQARARR